MAWRSSLDLCVVFLNLNLPDEQFEIIFDLVVVLSDVVDIPLDLFDVFLKTFNTFLVCLVWHFCVSAVYLRSVDLNVTLVLHDLWGLVLCSVSLSTPFFNN